MSIVLLNLCSIPASHSKVRMLNEDQIISHLRSKRISGHQRTPTIISCRATNHILLNETSWERLSVLLLSILSALSTISADPLGQQPNSVLPSGTLLVSFAFVFIVFWSTQRIVVWPCRKPSKNTMSISLNILMIKSDCHTLWETAFRIARRRFSAASSLSGIVHSRDELWATSSSVACSRLIEGRLFDRGLEWWLFRSSWEHG